MKKAFVVAAALTLSGSVAFAGGPVVIQDEGEPVAIVTQDSSSSGGAMLPLILGVLVVGAVAGGSGT
ncbi:MAG: hypothetical protein R3D63_17550 [Paracoccaceae bacterium]